MEFFGGKRVGGDTKTKSMPLWQSTKEAKNMSIDEANEKTATEAVRNRERLLSTVTSRGRPIDQTQKYNLLKALLVNLELVPDAFQLNDDDLIRAARAVVRMRRDMNNSFLPVSIGLEESNPLAHFTAPEGVRQPRANVGSTDLYKLLHEVSLDSLSTESLDA